MMKIFNNVPVFLFGLVFFAIFNGIQANELFINKNVWVYWDRQIQKAPIFVQLCLQKMRMVCEQENWQLILLTQQNLHQYIPNYQTEFLQIKTKRQHPEWTAGLADLIRLSVLDEHGGVWFDISTILTHGLNWLENLDKTPYLLANSDIQKGKLPDLLIPYLSYYQSISQRRDSEGKIQKFLPGYEAWFIASKKKAPPLTEWRKRYIERITTPEVVNRKIQIQKGYFTNHLRGEYLNVDKTINEIVEEKQLEIDKNLILFEERKNANKQLKIVGFHGQYGPFSIHLNYLPQKDLVLTHTLQQIEEEFYITINFFAKFTKADRQFYDQKIQHLINLYEKYGSFEKYMQSDPSLEDCKQTTFILEDSVFGRLIKGNKLAQNYHLHPITINQRQLWTNHCQKRFYSQNKITEVQSRCGGQIKNIWDLLCFFHIINDKTRVEIINYLQHISWQERMGRMSIDLEEVFYWKKTYQQKCQMQNNPQKLSQSSLRQKLKFFAYSFIMKNKRFIIKCYQILKQYYEFFYQFTAVTLLSYLTYKILLKTFKFKLRPLKQMYFCVKNIAKYHQNNHLLKKIWSRFYYTTEKNLKKTFISILLISSRVLRNIFISVVFIFFQIFIIGKFIRICIDGDTDFQEPGLIGIILTQFAFRKIIFDFLSPKSWFIPGISLQLLYRIFSPVYRVCLGRCIIEFAEKRQEWNFGLMFPICLGLPTIMYEVEFQVKKLLKKLENTKKSDKKGLLQRLRRNWGMIFSNLNGIGEGVVLGFLVLCYNVPNIRYMYVGEKLLIRRIVDMVWELQICFFAILMILYIADIFGPVKKIVRKWKNNCYYQRINLEQYSSESVGDRFDMKQSYVERKPSQSQSLSSSDSFDFIQNINQNAKNIFQRLKKIFNDVMSMLLNSIRYGINSYILFKLTISPYPDFVYNNVEQIWRDRILEVLLLLIINFQVQNVLLQSFYKLETNKPSNKEKNQGNQPQLQSIFEKKDNFRDPWYVVGIGIFLFQIVRLNVFEQLFGYFDVINANQLNLKQGLENQWPSYNRMIINFTFGGYWLLKLMHRCIQERNIQIKKNQLDSEKAKE